MGEDHKVSPEYYDEEWKEHAAKKRLLVLGLSTLVVLLMVLGLVTFIVWLVLHPIHSPTWTVDDVTVMTFNIQSSASRRRLSEDHKSTTNTWGVTTFLLNADMAVALRACNRNRHMDVVHERIDMEVAYATAVFGRVTVPGFTQATSNVTYMEAEMKAMSVPVSFVLANALQSDIQTGSLDFDISVRVRARVRIGGYRSFAFGLKTTCEISTTTPTSGRPGQVVTKKCRSHGS